MPSHRKPARRADLPSDEELTRTLGLFTAMAHEGRLRTLIALGRLGPLSAGALVEQSRLEQTALSHQLRILREARLVATEREGKHVIYSLADQHVGRLVEDAIAHASEITTREES